MRYDGAKRNIALGVQLMSDEVERVQHYEDRGGPDLFTNKRLSIPEILPVGYQMSYMTAFGGISG